MKTVFSFFRNASVIFIGLCIVVSAAFSAEKTEKFTVFGNCGQCRKTIERSLKNVEGISSAEWSKKTKIMEVTFDDSKISLQAIKQKIADAGYDSEDVRAKDEVYENLHSCCKYERPKKKQ